MEDCTAQGRNSAEFALNLVVSVHSRYFFNFIIILDKKVS